MLNKIRKLREKKGFTLVELIVVIAIIAILTAVLVPLIGNWTQQAAYTTLQDGAQTISNSINTAIAKVTMGGAPSSIVQIAVTKKDNKVTISVDKKSGDALTGVNKEVADEVLATLSATLPNDSAFLASITGGAVDGVIYRNDKNTEIVDGKVTKASGDFDNAYEYTPKSGDTTDTTDTTKYAVGVSGKFKGVVTVETESDNKIKATVTPST